MEVFRGIAAGIGGAVIFFAILAVGFGKNVTNLTEQSPEERSTSALEQAQQREQQAQQERERRALAQAQARAQAQEERRERARTASVLTLLREYGVIERYLITGVVVEGDDVTVTTRMFPKEDNAKFFAGACS